MRAALPRRHLVHLLAAAALCIASGASVGSCGRGSGTYQVRALFSNGQGLFPGAAVEVLGVREGTVTAVANRGSAVLVTVALPVGRHLPADVHAALVDPQLLGEPDVDFFPGYTGGMALAPGSTVPLSKTSVPVSIGQLLRQLKGFLGSIDARSASALIHNLAVDFQGEGAKLNRLIQGAAGTLQILAQKGGQLGHLEGNLASVSSALDGHLAAIEDLVVSYDKVSGVVAAHNTQIDDAITQLTDATTQVAALLSPNLQSLQSDVATITTVGRTLDRNIANLDSTLQSSVALFAGAHRAFDPQHNWIALDLQNPPGLSEAAMAGFVRDRLAGVCRRILAHNSSGLSAAQTSALTRCGDPTSGYFDPLLAAILGGSSGSGTTSGALFSQGLQSIPGLSPAKRSALAGSGTGP